MSRRFLLLGLGAAIAGVGTGYVILVSRDLTLASTRNPEALPQIPGLPLPRAAGLGWEQPSQDTPEGRLIRQILEGRGEFGRDRLLALLVHTHPAVRQATLLALGKRMKGSLDELTVRALLSRLENERDPVVRSAAKSALQEVTGEDRGEDAETWKSWWTARQKNL